MPRGRILFVVCTPRTAKEFYADLPVFTEFDGFAEFAAYAPVPEDWVVLCGDVQGSTRAIAEGRYKQVNMVGAAVITAVLNVCGRAQVPFVFGGDGGLAVVPGALAEAGSLALRRLQGYAESAFGLGLRAAAVPVARLLSEGREVRVRKFALSPGNHLAMFAGGGVERAEELMKQAGPGDPAILTPDLDARGLDLEGLSCRWEPLAASRGQMIALMVQPLGGDAGQGYRHILSGLTRILSGGIAQHAPASDATLRFRWPPRGLGLEARATAGRSGFLRAYLWALVTSALQSLCERRGLKIGPYDGAVYRHELMAQTDFRKFDDMLRTVLDVTADEADRIERWLDEEHYAGRLVYGLHRDAQALMTCLVFSLEQSEHVHFIDAAGGGFARAAEGFKARLAAAQGFGRTPAG